MLLFKNKIPVDSTQEVTLPLTLRGSRF